MALEICDCGCPQAVHDYHPDDDRTRPYKDCSKCSCTYFVHAGVPINIKSEEEPDYISIDWYDGPLLEIAGIEASDPSTERLVQVRSLFIKVEGDAPWQYVTLRFYRENLQKMLDLLDGKPVEDSHDRVHRFPKPQAT
jgi:hypothetical protein